MNMMKNEHKNCYEINLSFRSKQSTHKHTSLQVTQLAIFTPTVESV